MEKPLCTLQHLSLTFPHKAIFKDVTFTLHEGDKIGVIGPNGQGKSSLFKVLMGLQSADTTVPPFVYDQNKDLTVFYLPQELPHLGEGSMADYFYCFYPTFFDLKKKIDEISSRLAHESLEDREMQKLLHEQEDLYAKLSQEKADLYHAQYISYLRSFGIEDVDASTANLSGGEQRKMALSLGLSCPHQVVLWDEPTNHLDLATIERFEEELQLSKKTMMIISHDRTLLNNVVDRIIHIHNGKLKSFQGTYSDYLTFLQEEQLRLEKELNRLDNYHRRETAWIMRGARARRTKSKKRIETYQELSDKIQSLKDESHKQVSLQLQHAGRKTKMLVEAQNLSLTLGTKELFNNINFSLAKGDKIALIGSNGVGKSSLLKLILSELNATSGELKKAIGLDIGHFSQKREELPSHLTPWELIGEGQDFVVSNMGTNRHVVSYLEDFLFQADEVKRPIHTFSGGEKNRLQLAQFMKHGRDLWIFDEPTNDLDLETIGILEEELKSYEGALIVVCHDRSFIENVTNRCWLLNDQKLEIFEGGLAQAELFLETLSLEKDLAKIKASAPSSSSDNQNKVKLSHKEKKLLESLPLDIEKLEQDLKEKEEALAQLDYSQKEAPLQAKNLSEEIDKDQKKLEELLDMWVSLENKQ